MSNRQPPHIADVTGPQILRRHLIALILITALVWAVPPAAMVVCALAAAYALRGSRQALEALILLALLLLMAKGPLSVVRWLVLFSAFGRVIWDTAIMDGRGPKILWPLVIFCLYVFVFSLFASDYPDVSIFKLVSFGVGSITILVLFHRTHDITDYWLSVFYTLGVFILGASLPLYFFGPGYDTNGAGFQGILSHPQTYGPVLAPFAALTTGLFLFRGSRNKVLVGAVLLAWYGMYSSGSRTSILSTGLALAITTVFILPREGGLRRLFVPRQIQFGTYIVAACLIFAVLWNWTEFEERARGFLIKDDPQGEVDLGTSFQDSRGRLVAWSMYNFRRSPIIGIGFGVPSDDWDWRTGRLQRGFLGLPTSASVEKGFLPTAVLEEVGIVGTSIFVVLLLALFWPMIKLGSPLMLWMSLSALLTNLGEATFFSLGGIGFFFFLVFGFCYSRAEAQLAAVGPPTVPISPAYESADQRRFGPYGRRRHLHPKHPSLAASRSARQ
ncbi:MAG TPA: hypothetical protein VF190_01005 [Rhodothermales bacterium]